MNWRLKCRDKPSMTGYSLFWRTATAFISQQLQTCAFLPLPHGAKGSFWLPGVCSFIYSIQLKREAVRKQIQDKPEEVLCVIRLVSVNVFVPHRWGTDAEHHALRSDEMKASKSDMNQENRKSKSVTFPTLLISLFNLYGIGSKLHSFTVNSGTLLRLFVGLIERTWIHYSSWKILIAGSVMRDEGYVPRAVLDAVEPFPELHRPDVALPHLMWLIYRMAVCRLFTDCLQRVDSL